MPKNEKTDNHFYTIFVFILMFLTSCRLQRKSDDRGNNDRGSENRNEISIHDIEWWTESLQ